MDPKDGSKLLPILEVDFSRFSEYTRSGTALVHHEGPLKFTIITGGSSEPSLRSIKAHFQNKDIFDYEHL